MPKLFSCPHCGYSRSWVLRRSHRRCKQCRREWSPGTQFLVRGVRTTRDQWRTITEAFLAHETIVEVTERCRLAYGTAQKIVTIIRTAMLLDVPGVFKGRCEADETYVGGAWKNKAVHIRRQGAKRGRGTQKQCIFGILGREQQQVRLWCVPNAKRCTLLPIIEDHVTRGSAIYTDGLKAYRILPKRGYHHEWVDHDAGEYVRGDVHTQTLDGYFGLLKNALAAIGGIRKERLALYLGDRTWRYNFRNLTLKEKVERLLSLLKRFGGRN